MPRRSDPPANNEPILVPIMREIRRTFGRFAPLYIDERRERARFIVRSAVHELLSVPTATATKGDLITWSGSRSVRVGVGSNNQVLTADNTAPGGIKWAASSGGSSDSYRDNIRAKRIFYFVAHVEANQIKGPNVDLQRDSGSLSESWSAGGGFLVTTTGTGTGARARYHLNGNTSQRMIQLRADPGVTWRIRTGPDLTRALYFIGFSSGRPTNSTDGGSSEHVMFRFLAGTDTKWMASVNDGSNHSVTALGTSVAADTVYDLSIDYSASSGAVTFAVNESDTVAVSSNLPNTSTLMGLDATTYNNTSGGSGIGLGISGCYLEIK